MGNGVAAVNGTSEIRPGVHILDPRHIGEIVLDSQTEPIPHEQARQQLVKRTQRLIDSKKYYGTIVVDGDVVLLTNMPFSGGRTALFGLEKKDNGYVMVNYEDMPDYMLN